MVFRPTLKVTECQPQLFYFVRREVSAFSEYIPVLSLPTVWSLQFGFFGRTLHAFVSILRSGPAVAWKMPGRLCGAGSLNGCDLRWGWTTGR